MLAFVSAEQVTTPTLANEPSEQLATRLVGLDEDADISAVDVLHDFLLIGVDETVGRGKKRRNVIQLMTFDGADFVKQAQIPLCRINDKGNCKKSERKEMDVEAITVDGDTVYVTGSHATPRRRIDEIDNSYEENRAILSANSRDDVEGIDDTGWKNAKPRERLIRFDLDESGQASNMQEISLAETFDRIDALKPFRQLPSKENGVDIEGLAIRDGKLFAGLRGPVFNGGYAVALRLDFEAIAGGSSKIGDKNVRFIQLGGLGIRSLASVADGFLVLAGPVGDAPGPYRLYLWDGEDMVPGAGSPGGEIKLLGAIETSAGAKPEGLIIFDENPAGYEIGVVEDSADPPLLRKMTVPK